MIPSDVVSRHQVSADVSLRPIAPTQEISDKLSGLVAGQKIMAEIQSMLPNGTYRAIINQRNLTLALPFSAKSGDSLELLVTESDGKLALAVLSRPEGESSKTAASTSATLSRTGQLISTLFSGTREAKGGAVALPLNSNQPIASAPPSSALELTPLLKQAIAQSGMFYEAHQAEWVEGRFAKAALLQEPQGKLSSPEAFTAALVEEQASATLLKTPPGGSGDPATTSGATAMIEATASDPSGNAGHEKVVVHSGTSEAPTLRPGTDSAATQNTVDSGSKPATAQTSGPMIAPQTQAVVQQQLDALATQTFAWQGQVWPGQEMHWEIDEDAARHGSEDDESAAKWTTRLNLTLPNLGEISAQIRLQDNQVSLTMSAGNAETRALIRASSLAFKSQLDEAGLTLASMGVNAATNEESDGQAEQ